MTTGFTPRRQLDWLYRHLTNELVHTRILIDELEAFEPHDVHIADHYHQREDRLIDLCNRRISQLAQRTQRRRTFTD